MFARSVSVALLNRLREGRVELLDQLGRRTFGPADAPLAATVRAHDDGFLSALPRGSLALAESYADGAWDSDDLVTLVRIGALELPRIDRWRRPLAPMRERVHPGPAQHALRRTGATSPPTTTSATTCSGSSSTSR